MTRVSAATAFRNTMLLGVDRVAQLAATLLASALLARGMGPAAYGDWQLAASFLFILATLTNVVSGDVLVPMIVRSEAAAPAAVATALRLRFVAALAGIVLGLVLVLTWPGLPPWLMLALLPLLLREPLQAVYLLYVARGDVRPYFLASLLSLAIRLGGTWAIYASGLPPLFYVLPLYAENAWYVGRLGWLALAQGVRPGLRLPAGLAGALLIGSRWSWLAGLALLGALRLDRPLLSLVLSAEQLGHYVAAAQVNDNWYYIGLLIGSGVGPALVYRAPDHLYLRNTLYLMGLVGLGAFLAAAAIALLANDFAVLVFGSEFAESGAILSQTVWAYALIPIEMTATLVFLRAGRLRWMALKNLCILAVTLGLGVLLFPSLGLYAPAAAIAVSFTCSIAVTLLLAFPMQRMVDVRADT